MWGKVSDFFAGIKMTVVSGVFLLGSLVCLLTGIKLPVDPAWVTVILSGYPLLYLAITRLFRQKWISSALLISIAMIASLCIGELFAAGEVAFIMAIGAILEDMTVARAKKGLSGLIALAPEVGRRMKEVSGKIVEEMIPVKQIQVNDVIRILPGERVPVDGVILSGITSVDQSIMTGESLPVDKKEGESVFCGTMNCFGSIDIAATGVGQDSSLQKLIVMMQEAENKKAPMQCIADKWAVWLVPVALLIAIGAFGINLALGMDMTAALNRGVTVLVVFCPCALALATPTSIMAAIGQATAHGVIIKSGIALEAMGNVDTIAFDKTGTLTYGKLTVSDVRSFDDTMGESDLLALVASAESKSEHPLGKAVVSCAKEQHAALVEPLDFHMEAGLGIRAKIDGSDIYCGNEAYLKQYGIFIRENSAIVELMETLQNQGKALILAAADQKCIGVIALSDVLRPDAKEMVFQLNEMNTRTVLLTGDNEKAAKHFASQAGISSIRAELLPGEKVNAIEKLREEGKILCMIGDGVNDTPALKTADVGIAMGSMGSDIAVEAADIALMSDDISKIPYLKRLSRATLRTIKGNITASMCINAVAVALSAFGVLNPVTGALVHNAGSVLVVLNAALLYDRKFE